MALNYNVTDSGGHVSEPFHLWDEYMDPAFRDHGPRMIIDDKGKERLTVESTVRGNRFGLDRPVPLSPEAKRQIFAGAMGFLGLL